MICGATGTSGILLPLPTHLSGAPAAAVQAVGLTLFGVAFGLTMQIYALMAQRHAPADHMGSLMASLGFARQLGGSIGIAAYGRLSAHLDPAVPNAPRTSALTGIFAAATAILAICAVVGLRRPAIRARSGGENGE
jgi:hypothetical protein